MLTTARRLGTLAATALSASVLALPVLPAHAVPLSRQVLFTVVDSDNDGNFGVVSSPTVGGTPTVIVRESTTNSVNEVSASQDGSRIVTVEDAFVGTTDHSKVVVRDASGRLIRVLQDSVQTDAQSSFAVGAKLSPKGDVAVWTHLAFSATSFSVVLQSAPVAGGAPTTLPGTTNLVLSSFLDDTTLIARTASTGVAKTLPVTGLTGSATAQPIANAPMYAADLTVSPDGAHLAWSTDKDPNGNGTLSVADIQVATLSVANGTATVGAPTSLTSTLNNLDPAWISNTALDFVRNDGDVGSGEIWTAPIDGLTPASLVATTADDEIGIATGSLDGVAPGAATATTPFGLRGTAATIAWTLPADPDVSGVVVTRTLGAVIKPLAFIAAPANRYNDSGLTLGSVYTYTITSVDRSGKYGPAVQRTMQALTAGAVFSSPTSGASILAGFPVTFGKGDPASTVFDVSYRTNGAATATPWVTHTTGVTRTFGSAASAGVAATTSTPGNSYRFQVTASDAYGNATAPTVSAAAVVPYDQTKATYSAGTSSARYSDVYFHSVNVLKTAGAKAVVTLTGNRFQVIGTRCPTCGVIDVFYGGRRLGTVDTYASTRKVRQVLFTVTWGSYASRTLTVTNRATAHRPLAYLDAFAMWR